MRKNRRSISLKLALLVSGTVAGFAIMELGVRLFGYYRETRRIRAWQELQTSRAGAARGEVPFGRAIRISQDPAIVYELLPNLTGVTLKGQPLETDRFGFRGPGYPERPSAGGVRIVGLGDSIMFGWGVREEDSFLRVLERMLNEGNPGTRFEVINTGVPGYNTAMEIATLEGKGLAFHPDVVIIHYVGNDLALPDFIARRDGHDYLSMTRSFLAELLSTRLSGAEAEDAPEPLRPASRREDTRGFEDDPARVPPEYRHMVGVEGYRTAMHRLGRLGEEHHFRVLVTVHGRVPDFVSEICAELGFSLLEVLPEVERYMREHGIDQYRGSELTVSKSDRHPSGVQHRLIAQVIYRHMLETGMAQPR